MKDRVLYQEHPQNVSPKLTSEYQRNGDGRKVNLEREFKEGSPRLIHVSDGKSMQWCCQWELNAKKVKSFEEN